MTSEPQKERLWPRRYPWTPVVDLIAKLRQEGQDGVENCSHFNGVPIDRDGRRWSGFGGWR
jgi:hypothetical protein